LDASSGVLHLLNGKVPIAGNLASPWMATDALSWEPAYVVVSKSHQCPDYDPLFLWIITTISDDYMIAKEQIGRKSGHFVALKQRRISAHPELTILLFCFAFFW